ncbi:MAG: hypothetical protein WDA16_10010 [Candidatus Thermoplasmatota archaeon]
MRPGDIVRLRESNEPVEVIAIVDAAGTLLVAAQGEEPFQVTRDDVATVAEQHGGCGCCG